MANKITTSNSYKIKIAQCIDNWLIKNKVSNAKFAKLFNTTETTVRRWRKGTIMPRLDTILDICDYMNITLLDMLDINNTLSSDEVEVLRTYKTDKDFKLLVDKYINDERIRKFFIDLFNVVITIK